MFRQRFMVIGIGQWEIDYSFLQFPVFWKIAIHKNNEIQEKQSTIKN